MDYPSQVGNDYSYCKFYFFPLAKLAQTESREGGGGRSTGRTMLLLKHRAGMGAVHQLNIYCPVLCCSSSPAEPPEDGRQGPTTAGLQRQAAPGRLRGWCQSTATRAGAAGPGPVPAPAASDGEG